MIELKDELLNFSFSEVHPSASVGISFQRTLRIPDDGNDYPLPPGLGRFQVEHVDDVANRVPPSWIEHGGVMLPMYQSEALWIAFDGTYDEERQVVYPFAIKIATGKINAVSGYAWHPGLHRRPRQDYVVVPQQPWLDGYCVKKGIIRQFVAMPLGAGYTAEEQITGKSEFGGLQIMAIPMKRTAFERRFSKIAKSDYSIRFAAKHSDSVCEDSSMGLAPGGQMKQEIFKDKFDLSDWDIDKASRCFIHIANSMLWRQITDGCNPMTVPTTAEEYNRHGLPWFDFYSDSPALGGSSTLAGLKSVAQMGKAKGDVPLPENQSVTPELILDLRNGLAKDQVREFKDWK